MFSAQLRRPSLKLWLYGFIPAAAALALSQAAAAAHPAHPPLPPPRPAALGAAASPTSPPPRSADLGDASAPPSASGCASLLASGEAIGQGLPPIVGPGACGVAAPVRLDAVILANGSRVRLEPPAVVACSMAERVVSWVREDIAPAVAASGHSLAAIQGAGGYECRSRDRLVGAKLSEHAKGVALDLDALAARGGAKFDIGPSADPPAGRAAVLAAVKSSACRLFTTVLGPGSDRFHAQSLHVDLDRRPSGYRICQWSTP